MQPQVQRHGWTKFSSHPPPLIPPPGGLHLPVWCCCPGGSLQQHWTGTCQCQALPGEWMGGDENCVLQIAVPSDHGRLKRVVMSASSVASLNNTQGSRTNS